MILLTNKMNSTGTHGSLSSNNNNEMKDEFDNYTNDKECLDGIVISETFNYKERCNTDNEEGSVHSHASIKDEDIDDLKVVVLKADLIPDCTDNKMCLNKTVICGEYINQEPCVSIQNYLSIKDENIDDLTVVRQKTEPMNDCVDNKVCIYETVISGGYIKEEPCDMEDESGSVTHNNFAMKGCEECGEEYDLYCLKCPMLIRIFDGNDANCENNRVRWTLPRNLLDIHETSAGVGIVALRAIPKGVVFGPFKGLDSGKDGTVSKWKLKNNELAYTKDSRWLNWMQYVKKADQSSQPNLTPFQYKNELYYRSDCHISMGDELLVSWDSYKKESVIQDMEDNYWEPQICEILDDTYACTLCCVGYKSIRHLKAHNSICPEKRNQNNFYKEIVKCDICKIYLGKKEYSDYHRDRCHESNKKRNLRASYHVDTKPMKCESCDMAFPNSQLFVRHNGDKSNKGTTQNRHIAVHNNERPFACHNDDKPFECTLCTYKAKTKSNVTQHMLSHNSDKPIACTLCPYKTTRNSILKQHMVIHDGDRQFACTVCPYKATTDSTLKRHIASHNDDRHFACTICPYKATSKSNLNVHVANHNADKPLACSLCSFKTTRNSSLKRHIATHKSEKPFTCTLCPYKATRSSTMRQHLATHNSEKRFACNLCPYRAKKKSVLKLHIATHNSDKLFACTLCPLKAKTKVTLKRHLLVHSDDRPFACTLCRFKAKKESTLERHIAAHNCVILFPCTLCSYKATTKSNLTRHIAAHKNDKPFACTSCSYKAKTNAILKQHVASHNE